MARNTNKLYHPFKELPPCVCPQCFKPALAYKQSDSIFAMVDEDGAPSNFVVDTSIVFHCLECGFTSDKFILTDSGWRFNPFNEDDYLREKYKRFNRDYNPNAINYLVDTEKGFEDG